MKPSLLILSLPFGVPAFFVAPPLLLHRRGSGWTSASTSKADDVAASPNDLELDRLKGEFKHLQNELIEELVQRNHKVDVEGVAEHMLDVAADAVAFQRYKKMEELGAAEQELQHATGDRVQAGALKQEAHEAVLSAEGEVRMLESMDSPYVDGERLRDLAVAHAAHHLEEDALELEVESRFQQLEASSKMEDAESAIDELREYEVRLRESAKQVRQHKTGSNRRVDEK
jgi:hypothetical protein